MTANGWSFHWGDGDDLEEEVVMIVPFCDYTKTITVLLKWLKCMAYEFIPTF